MSAPIYPDIEVNLSGEDGNGFFIIARVARALKKHGIPDEKIFEFKHEAMSGDYDHLLQTCMNYVNVI